jgi:hypothetical protein
MNMEMPNTNHENVNKTLEIKLERIKEIKALVEDYISNGPNENQQDWDEKDFFMQIGHQLTDEEIKIRKTIKGI